MFKNTNHSNPDKKSAIGLQQNHSGLANPELPLNSSPVYHSIFNEDFFLNQSRSSFSSQGSPCMEDRLVNKAFEFLEDEEDDEGLVNKAFEFLEDEEDDEGLVNKAFEFLDDRKYSDKGPLYFAPVQVPVNQSPTLGPGSALAGLPNLKPPTRMPAPPIPPRTQASPFKNWKSPPPPPPSRSPISTAPTKPLSMGEDIKKRRKKMLGCIPMPSCFGGSKSKKIKITSTKDKAINSLNPPIVKQESLAQILANKGKNSRIVKRTKF
ncbi:MAG: hypothetical protein KFW09_05440 [Oscillospiraceae bacterium]|nr:hypothetical protein [Oscillospiraceae bacterium]